MKKPATVHLIFGDDEFTVGAKAGEIIGSLVPEAERDFGLEEFDGRTDTIDQAISVLRRCIEALRTVGFLGSGKVVWLRDVSFLPETAGEKADAALKSLLDELIGMIEEGLPPGQKLVITSPKVDGRSALYRVCREKGEVKELSVPEKTHHADAGARDRARAELDRLKIRMSPGQLDAFVEKVGPDTRQIVSELEKLSLYMGDRRNFTREDLDSIVCAAREIAVWDLADAVGFRDLPKALVVLRQLLFQKEAAIRLVVGLERRLDDLAVMRDVLDKRWATVKDNGDWRAITWHVPPEGEAALSGLGKEDPRKLHPFRAAILAAQARRFTSAELSRCLEMTVGAHEQLVSTGGQERLILEMLLMRMLGKSEKS